MLWYCEYIYSLMSWIVLCFYFQVVFSSWFIWCGYQTLIGSFVLFSSASSHSRIIFEGLLSCCTGSGKCWLNVDIFQFSCFDLFCKSFCTTQNLGKTCKVFQLQLPRINMQSINVIFEDHRTYASSSSVSEVSILLCCWNCHSTGCSLYYWNIFLFLH